MSNPYGTPGQYEQKPMQGSGGEMQPLVDVAGWLSLIGWFNIVIGGLMCISLVWAVAGWLPLWMGFLMKNAADKLKSGQNQAAARDLSTFFTIIGVFTLIYLILLGIGLAIAVVMMIIGMIAAAANA